MWKLTITQKRKSETSDFMYEESLEFISEKLSKLTNLIEILSGMNSARETSYKIEKMKAGEGNGTEI